MHTGKCALNLKKTIFELVNLLDFLVTVFFKENKINLVFFKIISMKHLSWKNMKITPGYCKIFYKNTKYWFLFLFSDCSSTKHFTNLIDNRLCCPTHKYSFGSVIPVHSVFLTFGRLKLIKCALITHPVWGKIVPKKASWEIQDAKNNKIIMK